MTRIVRVRNRNVAPVNPAPPNPALVNPTPANPANPTPANQAPPPPQLPASPGPKLTKKEWLRLIWAIGTSATTFWISLVFLCWFAPIWYFWIKVLLSFIMAAFALAAFDAATQTKSGLGKSIILFILLQAGAALVVHYGDAPKGLPEAQKTEVVDETKQPVQNSEITEYNNPGTYPINLAEGQESNWIKVGPRRCFSFTNQKATFILKYRDGTIANSWDKGPWPDKYEFRIYNLSREQFDIIVN